MNIESADGLRELYSAPAGRAVKKLLPKLDQHCHRFIQLSPFLVLATSDVDGKLDSSPRGGVPGFVKVPDEHTILIPDAKGNNLLDSLGNILARGEVGLLFLIPGIDETLRVNGPAVLSRDERDLDLCGDAKGPPKLVIRVTVREAFLHCAKALMRSELWSDEARVERTVLPSMGEMLNDQLGLDGPTETTEAMAERYRPDL